MKIFQIPRGTKRWSLSLVKLKSFPAFLKMNSTSGIYSEFSKICRATIYRGRFCLSISQEVTVYSCDWFYFPVRSIWHSKEWFPSKFLVRRGTRTTCTAVWKRILFHCTHSVSLLCTGWKLLIVQFVMSRLKIVQADVYMKLWVPDNLVLFLYHSDINCSIVCG